MAHNLEIKNGKASFVAVGEKAWHGLGVYVPEPMTAVQVVELANMNYKVDKTPIVIKPEQSEENINFPGIYATYRTDNNIPLGIVSSHYDIVQNEDAFTFFDPIIERGEAIYQTAGVLGKGERVFITAKLPEDITVAGEKVEQYLLITNGHDGKNAVKIGFTPIRVVCNNTLTAALNGLRNSYTIPHYNNPNEKLKEAYKVMGLASSYMTGVSEIFEKMAETRISDDNLMAYIESLFVNDDYVQKKEKVSTRAKNNVIKIYEFAKNHPTQQSSATDGTLYGAYNAISGYFGHIKDYKSPNQRMESICFGYGANKTNAAFGLAVQAMEDLSVLDKKLLCI